MGLRDRIYENITIIYEKKILFILEILHKALNEIKRNELTNNIQKSHFQKSKDFNNAKNLKCRNDFVSS